MTKTEPINIIGIYWYHYCKMDITKENAEFVNTEENLRYKNSQ